MGWICVTSGHDSGKHTLRAAVEAFSLSPTDYCGIKIKVEKICLDTAITVSNTLKIKTDRHVKIKSAANVFVVAGGAVFEIDGCEHTITLRGVSSTNGGAINVTTDDFTLILKHVKIYKSIAATFGGGIYTTGAIIIIDSDITKNTSGSQGGGIFSIGPVTIKNSCISHNECTVAADSTTGGGIYVNNGNLILINSHADHNTVPETSGTGGGVSITAGNLYMTNGSSVNHNKGFGSAGIQVGAGDIFLSNKSSASHNQSFSDNSNGTTAGGGGGIYIGQGYVYINDSYVEHNKTLGMYSGGIVSVLGDVIVSEHSRINHNTNQGPGGAIATNFASSVMITDSEVKDNKGSSLGGAIVNFTGDTGGIFITNSCVECNELNSTQTIGQTIAVFESVITAMTDTLITQAEQNGGPGLSILETAVSVILAELDISIALFSAVPDSIDGYSLTSLYAGGALATILGSPIVVKKSLIKDNRCKRQDGFYSVGGAIFAYNGPISVEYSTLKKNKSVSYGGAIWSFQPLAVGNSVITKNKSQKGGGIRNTGPATITCSVVECNSEKDIYNGASSDGLVLVSSKVGCIKSSVGYIDV
jgi:hypothetical protein